MLNVSSEYGAEKDAINLNQITRSNAALARWWLRRRPQTRGGVVSLSHSVGGYTAERKFLSTSIIRLLRCPDKGKILS